MYFTRNDNVFLLQVLRMGFWSTRSMATISLRRWNVHLWTCVPYLARLFAKPELGLHQSNLVDARYSCYTRDIKQLKAPKPLDILKPRLLDLFAGGSFTGDISPQESRTGPSFTTYSIKGGSHPFPLDLAAAVCASPLTARCSR